MSIKHFALGAAALLGFAAIGVQPALAQVKVVTVTAQKRAEDVQDVPLAITAFSGDFLEDKGIDNISELNNYTPNFRVDTGNNPRNSVIRIRGLGSPGQNAGIEASVGIFLDGVYVPRIGAILGDLTDISTLEVLRGPQGTLYGRNTSVGALNINTREASQEFEAMARVGFGNYDMRNVAGYINGGITDSLSARFAFWASDFAGYEKNIATGAGINTKESWGGRTKFLWEANDSTKVNFIFDYQKTATNCCTQDYIFVDVPMINALNQVAIGTGVPLATQLAAYRSATDHVVANGGNQNNEDEQWGGAVVIDHDIDAGSMSGHRLRSVTAYRRWDFNGNFPQGDTYVNINSSNQTQLEKTLSQEFNLFSPDGGVDFFSGMKLEYTLGAYFFKQRSSTTNTTSFEPAAIFLPGIRMAAQNSGLISTAGGCSSGAVLTNFPGTGGATGCPFAEINRIVGVADDNRWKQSSRSYAFFTQTSLWIMPDIFKITGGLRYTKDKKRAYMDSTFVAGQRGASTTSTNQLSLNQQLNNSDFIRKPEEDAITWLANATYYVMPDVMAYFTASTGYKSPGVNNQPYRTIQAAGGAPIDFGSERTLSYETGVKSTLFDSRLVLNVNVFRTIVSNVQQNVNNPAQGPGTFVQNFGKLRQQGIEADMYANPVDWLDVYGSAGLLDSNWVDFTTGPCAIASTNAQAANNTTDYVAGTTLCNYNTHPNSYSPKWMAAAGATVHFPLLNTAVEWFAGGGWTYNGSMFLDNNLDRRSEQSRYMLFDANVGIKGGDGDWQLKFWGKNLFDRTYYSQRNQAGAGAFFGFADSRRVVYYPPRTLGIEGKVNF